MLGCAVFNQKRLTLFTTIFYFFFKGIYELLKHLKHFRLIYFFKAFKIKVKDDCEKEFQLSTTVGNCISIVAF